MDGYRRVDRRSSRYRTHPFCGLRQRALHGLDHGQLDHAVLQYQSAAAVVQAGETVKVASGSYTDPVTVTAVGTASAPITIEAAPGAAVTIKPAAQVEGVVTFQHAQYVTLKGLTIWSGAPDSVLVSGSDHVTVDGVDPTTGTIHVTGSTNTLVRGTVTNGLTSTGETAILVDGASSGTVIANNALYKVNRAIRIENATDTAITSNTIPQSCAAGIEVGGGSTRTTIENNILTGDDTAATTGGDASWCGNGTPVDFNTGAIAVDDTATAGTHVDDNVVWPGVASNRWHPPVLYHWGAVGYTTLTSFQGTGQAGHDIEADPLVSTNVFDHYLRVGESSPAIDSADSAAPGQQLIDAAGAPHVDDPLDPNAGSGPRTYDDRGAFEYQDPFAVTATATTQGLTTVTINASTTGWKPAASYTFDFGNGDVVTQASPTLTHTVAMPTQAGVRGVPVTVSATEQDTGTVTSTPITATFGYTAPTTSAKASVAWSQTAHSYLLTVDASGSAGGSMPVAGYTFIVEDQNGEQIAVSRFPDQRDPVFTTPVPDGTTIVTQTWAFDSLGEGGPVSSNSVTVPFVPAGSALISRIAGDDRYATAVFASQSHWAYNGAISNDQPQAKAAVLATGTGFADAVAGVPLAAHVGGPLLLTEPNQLTPTTEHEITRILPTGSTVYLLGGTGALSNVIADRLTALGYHPQRLGGTDRYATARAIAHQLGDPTRVIVATGHDYADALAAGPLAAKLGAAILLSDGAHLDVDTATYIRRSLTASAAGRPNIVTVGGDGGRAVQTIANGATWQQLSGNDRYTTAALVAAQFTTDAGSIHNIGVATGTGYADALTGGALMATLGSPLTLTTPTQTPPSLAAIIQSSQWYDLKSITLFGGTNAISQQVQDQIAELAKNIKK